VRFAGTRQVQATLNKFLRRCLQAYVKDGYRIAVDLDLAKFLDRSP